MESNEAPSCGLGVSDSSGFPTAGSRRGGEQRNTGRFAISEIASQTTRVYDDGLLLPDSSAIERETPANLPCGGNRPCPMLHGPF